MKPWSSEQARVYKVAQMSMDVSSNFFALSFFKTKGHTTKGEGPDSFYRSVCDFVSCFSCFTRLGGRALGGKDWNALMILGMKDWNAMMLLGEKDSNAMMLAGILHEVVGWVVGWLVLGSKICF